MRLKTLGLLGALVFAVPVAAVAAPAGGLTAQSSAPATVTQALDTNAAVIPAGPTATVEKIWWRGGWGWRRGWGWRGGWGGYGWRGGWGWRRGCCWGGGWRRWGWRRW